MRRSWTAVRRPGRRNGKISRERAFVVTGTDTGIGKTVFAAALTRALDGVYWKPVQAGLDGETDSQIVARPVRRDRYCRKPIALKLAASPHRPRRRKA